MTGHRDHEFVVIESKRLDLLLKSAGCLVTGDLTVPEWRARLKKAVADVKKNGRILSEVIDDALKKLLVEEEK